jgi:CheY-like chemotaxis protein
MAPAILLVDDQRDVLRLLHSVLDTLQHPELEIIEALSGAEALVETSRRHIDLAVIDYVLPGMTGIEVMHKARAVQPDIKVILISGTTDRNARAEMHDAGAAAVFEKPVPLADFLDAVERSLALRRTIFPDEAEGTTEPGHARFSELLANLRQDIQASAVFLINDRGLVVARAGDLRDSSNEVSLVSALTATSNAGLKVAKSNRQESLDQYSVFTGGDHDLILMPIDASFSLLLAGNALSSGGTLSDAIEAMKAVRSEVVRSLRSMGAMRDQSPTTPRTGPGPGIKPAGAASAPEMETLLKEAGRRRLKREELDAFWDEAVAKHTNAPTSPDAIPYDEARKLGLTPDEK